MQTELKQARLERLLRALLGLEVVTLLLISGLKWFVYRNYTSQSCIGYPFRIRWKDAVFCVDSSQIRLWHLLDFLILAIFLAFVATSIFCAIWKLVEKRRS